MLKPGNDGTSKFPLRTGLGRIDITETSHENINAPSIKSKVNPKKDTTLQVQISRNLDDKGAQQKVASVKSPPVSTKKQPQEKHQKLNQ